jgi:hypothetical protein
MPKYILHIGLMKTGTTALQSALHGNRDRLLSKGVLYPSSSLLQSKHVQLVWSCVKAQLSPFAASKYSGMTTAAYLDAIEDERHFTNATTCIVSAEDFSIYQPQRFQGIVDAFQKDLRIVVYLRPQDEMIESMYRQRLKGAGITDRFEDFVASAIRTGIAGIAPLDYDRLLGGWADMAGDDRLTVKVYGNKARQDIVNEFISAAGLQLELESLKERANVSFEGPYAEFVRSANRYIPQHVRHEFVADVEALQESHPAKPTSLLSPQLRDHIHRQYHRSNAAVARNFLAKQMLFDGSD